MHDSAPSTSRGGHDAAGRLPVLVVADDLTGANAAAAGFARAGLRAVTLGFARRPALPPDLRERFDAVVVTTDSRHCSAAEAAERARAAVEALGPAQLTCNRIDTTLRGNIGATTRALLAALSSTSGRRTVALCQPAHPLAGRTTVHGLQLLEGARIETTDVARDVRTPVTTSSVRQLLHTQAALECAEVHLPDVTGPASDLDDRMRAALDGGCEVVIADATNEVHLDVVAAAALRAGPDVEWLAVGPGPAAVLLSSRMRLQPVRPAAPLLLVSGSATRLTRLQLDRLLGERVVEVVRPVMTPAGVDEASTAARLRQALTTATDDAVVLLATALGDEDLLRLEGRLAAALPEQLAGAVHRALLSAPVGGLFTSGGDLTAALLLRLGAIGLDVGGEVEPLAVEGTLVGGDWAGLPVITKGGLVGDARSVLACVDRLQQAAVEARRRTPALHDSPDVRRTTDHEGAPPCSRTS